MEKYCFKLFLEIFCFHFVNPCTLGGMIFSWLDLKVPKMLKDWPEHNKWSRPKNKWNWSISNLRNLKENLSDFLVAARTGGWRGIRGPYLEKGFNEYTELLNWYPQISHNQSWNIGMMVWVSTDHIWRMLMNTSWYWIGQIICLKYQRFNVIWIFFAIR